MLKDNITKIEDSNIANYGGEDHQNAKDAKANAEAEYKGAGQAVGIEIWRIENFGVKKWPKDQYGTFFSGDCYIVLNTYKPDPKKEKFAYNAHFWLGKDSTQDESGTAAFKVVELDDLLGDLPVQFREVQGYESQEFLGIFDGVIKLLDGGIDSAFNKVEPEKYTPRLLQFKGKKDVRVSEVPVATASLNHGDVFLLDLGLTLIQWNGKESSAWEKRKAASVVAGVKGERGKCVAHVVDGDEDNELFWTSLGGKSGIGDAIPDVEAKAYVPTLSRVSDATGEVVITEVASGKSNINKGQLDTNDVFILDIGDRVYVWIGAGATKNERSNGIKTATDFLTKSNRPMHTPITRLAEGAETPAFNDFFAVAVKIVKQQSNAETKNDQPFQAQGSFGEGCYLTYDEASNGTLFLNWKKAELSGAIAYLSSGKKVPNFKFTSNAGKSELTRNLSDDQNLYQNWANFAAMSRTQNGLFCQIKADVLIHVLIGTNVHRIELGKFYNLATCNAVAITKANFNPFEGVTTIGASAFLSTVADRGAVKNF